MSTQGPNRAQARIEAAVLLHDRCQQVLELLEQIKDHKFNQVRARVNGTDAEVVELLENASTTWKLADRALGVLKGDVDLDQGKTVVGNGPNYFLDGDSQHLILDGDGHEVCTAATYELAQELLELLNKQGRAA